jgi:phage anti-repressor protein
MSIIQALNKNNDISAIKDPYIKRALETSFSMLTIYDFIKYTNYPIDNFFDNLNEEMPIYITKELIEWCGYSGSAEKQKQSFSKLLSNFEEGKDYWIYSNKEYEEYYNPIYSQGYIENSDNLDTSNRKICKYKYPHPDEFVGKNKTKHLVLTTDCFKMIMMMLTTPKAHTIRLYFLGTDKLVKIYVKYQLCYQSNQVVIKDKKIDELIEQMKRIADSNEDIKEGMDNVLEELDTANQKNDEQRDEIHKIAVKLDVATDERAPKTKSITKHGKFMLLTLNAPESEWSHYVIRAQRAAANAALNRMVDKFPDLTIDTHIEYQPNAINLFNLIKEKLRNKEKKIECSGNYIKLLDGYDHGKFLADIRKMDSAKKQV